MYPGVSIWNFDNPVSPAYFANLLSGTLPAGSVFTRASPAWSFDSTGTRQTSAVDVSRRDYNPTTLAPRGLLIEEAKSNMIRNSELVGAAVGTPGTLATNMQIPNVGVAANVVSTSTVNGMPCNRIQFVGTPSSSPVIIYLDTIGGIPCVQGDVFTLSVFLAMAAGSLANISAITLRNAEYNSVPTYLADTGSSSDIKGLLTSSLTRFKSELTYVIKGATAASCRPYIALSVTVGQPVNISLDIAAAQFETGASMTSVIPTSSGAVTRAAESLTITSPAWLTATGSISTQFTVDTMPLLDVDATIMQLDSGADTANTRLRIALKNGTIRLYGSGKEANLGVYTQGSLCTVEVSWDGNVIGGRLNGGTVREIADGSTASFTTVRFGRGVGGSFLNGAIQTFSFYAASYLLAPGLVSLDMSTSDFDWVPYSIYVDPASTRNAVSGYSFYAERPAAGATYYIAPTGLDANDGLTEKTPLKTLSAAFGKADIGTLIFASGVYDRNTSNAGTITLARDVTMMTKDGLPAVLLGSDQNVAWTVNGTYSNVHQRTRNNITGVWDSKYLDENGDWVRYTNVASVALVSATAGSYYNDGTVTYVRTSDGRMPDNDIQVTLTISLTFAGQYKYWMDNIHFLGLNSVKWVGTTPSSFPTVYGRNVWSKYSPDNNGFSMQGTESYFMDCIASKDWLDGFNYHLAGTKLCKSFEIGCTGRDSRYTGNTSQNGTTTHEGNTAVRINGSYGRTNGPTIADINDDTTSLNVNCRTFGTQVAYLSGNLSTDTTKQYLINCLCEGSTLYDLLVNNAAMVRYYGSQTFSTSGSGTITKVTDLSQIFAV